VEDFKNQIKKAAPSMENYEKTIETPKTDFPA